MGSIIPIYINGLTIDVNPNVTILQACGLVGIYIPRFCYHEKLSIVGSCRMCLVELYKSIKPVVACATPVYQNIEVYTETALTKNSREHILEFLLINHPLDCPICDQGGECDLQDQSLVYGSDRGRFKEKKRAVINKDFGPFIKTVMTRCIHCTRCVRFMSEIANENVLGTLGRGKDMEIGTYINTIIRSEVSGNIIDICPVGALTSKPFAFTNRAWELRSVESVDIMDSIGSSIRLDFRGSEIVRILPVINESLNEHWITDKIRFTYDGFKHNRLITPLLKKKKWSHLIQEKNEFQTSSWERSIYYFVTIIVYYLFIASIDHLSFYLGELVDIQTTMLILKMSNILGISNIFIDSFEKKKHLNMDIREHYLLNKTIKNFEFNTVYMFMGSNISTESPLLNIRLNKFYNTRKTIGLFGSFKKNMHNINHLGFTIYNIYRILEGKHYFCKILKQYNNISWFSNVHHSFIYNNLNDYFGNTEKDTNITNQYNLIHNDCSKIGLFDLGITSQYQQISNYLNNEPNIIKLGYYVGTNSTLKNNKFSQIVIYQGHHNINKNQDNIILYLPSTSFIEKSKKYVNNTGRLLFVKKAITAPGLAKDDTSIIYIINLLLRHNLDVNMFMDEHLLKIYLPHLFYNAINFKLNTIYSFIWYNNHACKNKSFDYIYNIFNIDMIDNYYKTNTITLASKILNRMDIILHNYFI